MFLYFNDLHPIIGYGIVVLSGLLLLFLGWKSARLISWLGYLRRTKKIDEINDEVKKGMKKIWDGEKLELEEQLSILKEMNDEKDKKIEAYRRKIAGLGRIDWFAKKRKEILYSLLLENEALEQIILDQSKKLNRGEKDRLKDRLSNLKENQAKVSGIFSNGKMKQYVQDVLAKENLKSKSLNSDTNSKKKNLDKMKQTLIED